MFSVKLFRKLGKLLRGGAGSREIFIGVFFGFVLGMVPGFNLTLLLLLLAAVVLNANLGAALPIYGVSKGIALAVAPISFRIGYLIIHGLGLEGLFRSAAQTPVLALFNLQNYCLIGGVPIAMVVGLLVGLIFARLADVLRRGILEAAKRSPKMEKLGNNFAVRLFLRLVFGKQKAKFEDSLGNRSPLFRKGGIILVAAVLVVSIVAEFVLLDYFAAKVMRGGLQKITGAQVDIADVDVSLFGGSLRAVGIAMTDSQNPRRNAIEVEAVEADLSVSDLLTKRFVVNRMTADGVSFDTERARPGEVFEAPAEEPDSLAEADKPGKSLDEYLAQAESYEKHLQKIQDYLEKRKTAAEEQPADEIPKPDQDQLIQAAGDDGFFSLSADEFLTRAPLWVIREIGVTNVAVGDRFGTVGVRGTNWSSRPEWIPKPMSLAVTTDVQEAPLMLVEFRFYQLDAPHSVACVIPQFPLAEVVDLSDDLPLNVQQARVKVTADGAFAAASLDVGFDAAVTELKAKPAEGKGVLGMDDETTAEVFQYLDHIQVSGRLVGSFDDMRLELDEDEIIANLQKALTEAGKKALASRVNKEVEAAREKAREKAKEEIQERLRDELSDKVEGETGKRLAGELEKSLGDEAGDTVDKLLGGKKDEEDETEEDGKKKSGGLLKSLLGGDDEEE